MIIPKWEYLDFLLEKMRHDKGLQLCVADRNITTLWNTTKCCLILASVALRVHCAISINIDGKQRKTSDISSEEKSISREILMGGCRQPLWQLECIEKRQKTCVAYVRQNMLKMKSPGKSMPKFSIP